MAFEQTPLFQLNLVIFLTWPSPSTFVEPLFYKEGFDLYKIGPKIPTMPEAQARAINATPPISFTPTPSPDIVLRQAKDNILLLVECKKSSFGPDSKQASQAAALLSCVGPHVSNVFGLPSADSWYSIVWYVVGDDKASAMQDTIEALSLKLKAASITATASGCLGITIRAGGVYLYAEQRSKMPLVSLKDAGSTGVRVMALSEGEDPRPLYLIPIDPSITVNDSYEKQALEERVRAALASTLGRQLDQTEFIFDLDDLMRVAIEVWDVWADRDSRKSLKNAVRAYVRLVFHEINKLGLQIALDQDRITIHHITPTVAADTRRYLSSTAYRKGQVDLWSSTVQLDFSSLAEGW